MGTRTLADSLYYWQENDQWVVGCTVFDVVAQGPTPQEAMNRFFRTFTLDVLLNCDDSGVVSIPHTPTEIITRWKQVGKPVFGPST